MSDVPGPRAPLLEVVTALRSPTRLSAAARARVLDSDGDLVTAERGIATDLYSDLRRARRSVARFAAAADVIGTDEARGRAARLRASWLTIENRYADSVTAYEEAEALLRGAARDGARIGRAGALVRLGRSVEAARLCGTARAAAARRGDLTLRAAADFNAGLAWHEAGDPARAAQHHRRARDTAQSIGHGVMAALAAQNLANALVLLDQYSEARSIYTQAAEEFTTLGLDAQADRCTYNLGALFVATDQLGEADRVLAGVEERFATAGDSLHAGLARLDRAEALLRAGLVPEATHALASARRTIGKTAPAEERSRATLLLARARLAAGDARGARRLLARPLPLPTGRHAAHRIELLGRADVADGRFTSGRTQLLDAARRFGRHHPAARCRCLLGAAAAALADEDIPAARSLCRRASKTAAELGLSSLDFARAAVLFLVERRAGRRAAADKALNSATAAFEQLRGGLGPDAMRAAALRGRETLVAESVRHALEGEGDATARALQMLETWRARSLLDLVADAQRLRPLDPEEQTLRELVATLERDSEASLGASFLRDARLANNTPPTARRLARCERRMQAVFERARVALPRAPASISVCSASLAPGEIVLAPYADSSGGVLFVVDRTGVRSMPIEVCRGEVERDVAELHFVLGQFALGGAFVARHGQRLTAAADRVLARIARYTLDPLADTIDAARRIVFVPHGPWHRVPVAALPHRGRPLIGSVHLRSAPALPRHGASSRAARGRALVVGVGDSAVPAIEQEARAVGAQVRGSQLLVGADAVLAGLRPRAAPRLLHVAAHGRFRPDAPAMSGMRLHDGWLRAADLATLPLGGSTVVLSGCETGVAAVDTGEEIHGLVRAALGAGARAVVASLWRVDDAATSALMVRLHVELERTGDAACALAAAQSEAASAGLHPWYWAGFQAWQL